MNEPVRLRNSLLENLPLSPVIQWIELGGKPKMASIEFWISQHRAQDQCEYILHQLLPAGSFKESLKSFKASVRLFKLPMLVGELIDDHLTLVSVTHLGCKHMTGELPYFLFYFYIFYFLLPLLVCLSESSLH